MKLVLALAAIATATSASAATIEQLKAKPPKITATASVAPDKVERCLTEALAPFRTDALHNDDGTTDLAVYNLNFRGAVFTLVPSDGTTRVDGRGSYAAMLLNGGKVKACLGTPA